LHTPLHERLRDRDGFASAETAALAVLRAIEREARVARGRAVVARVAPEVNAWLEAGVIPWRDALSQRIGVRWSIEASPGLTRAHLDVRTV
jgi:Ribonuclease G/E